MANVFDAAKHILGQRGEMTAMKLQKLCYYAQAWSLAWDDEPLFPEDFQAWANGPVCPELFRRHKGLYRVDESLLKDVPQMEFAAAQAETLVAVLDYYGGMEPHTLSEITHKERPWRETREGVPPGDSCERVIPKQLMQDYYSSL
jgi:uncharacterized phage-associated protein